MFILAHVLNLPSWLDCATQNGCKVYTCGQLWILYLSRSQQLPEQCLKTHMKLYRKTDPLFAGHGWLCLFSEPGSCYLVFLAASTYTACRDELEERVEACHASECICIPAKLKQIQTSLSAGLCLDSDSTVGVWNSEVCIFRMQLGIWTQLIPRLFSEKPWGPNRRMHAASKYVLGTTGV